MKPRPPQLRIFVAVLLGAVLTLLIEHGAMRLLNRPVQVVELTDHIRVLVDGRLIADLGVGTRAEVSNEGNVYWLTVRTSFAAKPPPFRPTDGPTSNLPGRVWIEEQ